jgi:predicted Zn-dependent protease
MRRSRLLVAVVIAAGALLSYYGSREVNPVTGETQHIAISKEQEVALGLRSAPEMAEQFGGLEQDAEMQDDVEALGQNIVKKSGAAKTSYEFRFRVLKDPRTVNAFALPGGPVFITRALLDRLQNEAQLAGVLGHEIGHVVGRHSAEQLSKSQLAQGLVGAIGVATSDDQGGQGGAQLAAVVAQLIQLRYGRNDELEADTLGVTFMSEAGYDPRVLIEVMNILEKSSGGGGRRPEFLSTHPDPGNRRERIQEAIDRRYPNGVPPELTAGREIKLTTGAGGSPATAQ